jgi:radical SAM superfamily enzyme YgiQ (UPF0313 family)
MKIFFCYPPVSAEYDKIRDAGVAPHLSLLCLASHIRQTHPDVEITISDGHHDSMAEISGRIKTESPDIVGFSVDFTNYNRAIELADFVKQNNPNAFTVCGSNHASNLYNQILRNQPSMDFVAVNDGEESIEQLISWAKGNVSIEDVTNLAYRKDGQAVLNKPVRTFDLAKMQSVNYELMDLNRYFETQKSVFGDDFRMLQFTTQRGCSNKPLCMFCGRFDDGMRFRDPVACAKEIAHYTEKYDLTEVWDRSDSFVQNVRWLKIFAEELNRLTDRFRTSKTTFKTYSRADQLLRQEVIDVLKSLNFRMVFIGYEAGDDRILKNIGKHSNVDTYLRATENVLSNGIDIDASFIVGLPGENRESLRHHEAFVGRLIDLGLNKIRVNRLLVLPGTPIYRAVVKTFPEYGYYDNIPMPDLQTMAFRTELYDLSDFDNDVDRFITALNETAHRMSSMVAEHGGATEGYGHGKGGNISDGREGKKEKHPL